MKQTYLANLLQQNAELEVVLNKCLSCSDNEVSITAFSLLEKFYLKLSSSIDIQFNDGWDKDFDPKYPMKFYYSLKRIKIAQNFFNTSKEMEEEYNEGEKEEEEGSISDASSSSDSSTGSENNMNRRKIRKINSKKRQQNQCGPYDQFIALGGIKMLYNFIIEFDPINFENKQQCITYTEVCRFLFEGNQMVDTVFSIDSLINTFLNHVIALNNILPHHIDIDELNRLHEIQVRKKKRDAKYSKLYNSDDEDNNNNNNNRTANESFNFKVHALLNIYNRIFFLYPTHIFKVPDDILKDIIYVGVLSVANIDVRNHNMKFIEVMINRNYCNDANKICEICKSLFQPENIKEIY